MQPEQIQLDKLPPLLTVEEAAWVMRCSPRTAARRADEGKIKRVGDRHGTRYVTDSILAWIKQHAT